MGGCCSTESSVPDRILDDPAGPCEFFVTQLSAISSDYEVFEDEKNEKKWLLIDHSGDMWSDSCKFVVENYQRPEGGKIGTGQCLAAAEFEKINYKYYHWDTDVNEVYEDSDGDDSDFSDSGDEEDLVGVEKEVKCSWKADAKINFFKDRECKEWLMKIKVKAKGKAKRIERHIEVDDGDGGKRTKTTIDEKHKMKKFFYHLEVGGEKVEVDWKGKASQNAGLKWDCDLFSTSIPTGNFTLCPHVKTKSDNPGADLLLGFLIASQLKPTDFHDRCRPDYGSH